MFSRMLISLATPVFISVSATTYALSHPLSVCSYQAEGASLTGVRSAGGQSDDGRLQCNLSLKSDASAALAQVAQSRKIAHAATGPADSQKVLQAGALLACAHLLFGADTLDDAGLALKSTLANDSRASAPLNVVRLLQTGAKFSIATAADCKPEGFGTGIPDDVWDDMQGKSWHAESGCPARGDLSLLRIPYVDFEGRTRFGEMVVAQAVATDVLAAFARIYAAGSFPIASMARIEKFGGDDMASMAANNTSGFNCRRVSGSSVMSEHARGLAIDINPLQNPFVGRALLQPPGGEAYRDRGQRRPGMIAPGDTVTEAFAAVGWKWGGAWSASHDYQHFSQSGR